MDELRIGSDLLSALKAGDRAAPTRASAGGGFGELIQGVLAEANRVQLAAEDKAVALAKGEADVVDTVLAINEADLSLRFVMQLRDRALESYERILRSL